MISINPFSRDGYDNASVWIGGCVGFFGLLTGGLVLQLAMILNAGLYKKSIKIRRF